MQKNRQFRVHTLSLSWHKQKLLACETLHGGIHLLRLHLGRTGAEGGGGGGVSKLEEGFWSCQYKPLHIIFFSSAPSP